MDKIRRAHTFDRDMLTTLAQQMIVDGTNTLERVRYSVANSDDIKSLDMTVLVNFREMFLARERIELGQTLQAMLKRSEGDDELLQCSMWAMLSNFFQYAKNVQKDANNPACEYRAVARVRALGEFFSNWGILSY